jgi:hypothetical protein
VAEGPGRACPLAYRYGVASLARDAEFSAPALYVVGGLYGNVMALRAVQALHALEPDAVLVFNGDFNWFNVNQSDFLTVNRAVLRDVASPISIENSPSNPLKTPMVRAIRGNVETELLADDPAAGCGCGYPDWVGDGDVARSNAIMAQLAATARQDADTLALAHAAAALPMTLVAQVGDARVAIVHGDTQSLAGWDFTVETMDTVGVAALRQAAQAANLQVVASSHTCLPVAQMVDAGASQIALINNGAAGMPNFAGDMAGIVSRIGIAPAPAQVTAHFPALYGAQVGGVSVQAISLPYDHAAWLKHFDAGWEADSPAAVSYRKRIVGGPAHRLDDAVRAGFAPGL